MFSCGMHYHAYDEDLKLHDFEEFSDYVSYLYYLDINLLINIRRRLYKIKEVRRFMTDKILFKKDDIIKEVINATNELAINKRQFI